VAARSWPAVMLHAGFGATNPNLVHVATSSLLADNLKTSMGRSSASFVGVLGALCLTLLLTNTAWTQTVSFNSPQDYLVERGPHALVVGDFNNDGQLDFAVSEDLASRISILFGDGKGNFGGLKSFTAGKKPSAMVAGDFNKDGNLDLLVANDYSTARVSTVSLLLGNGDGTFQSPTQVSVGLHPVSVVSGDFNGDGNLDVAVVLDGQAQVAILLGKGDGTFQPPVDLTVGPRPYGIVAADFNGDNKVDLAVTDGGSGQVAVLLGNGNGTFRSPIAFPSGGTFPIALVTGDFNRDGKLDLVVANNNRASGNVAILIGNGDGTFQAPNTSGGFEFIAPTIAVGDFNGDGLLDLVVNAVAGQNAGANGNQVTLFLGRGDGTLGKSIGISMGDPATSFGVGDFNDDGRLDLAGAVYGGNVIQVRLNLGTDNFQAPIAFPTLGSEPTAVATGDFNGDGKLDLAVSHRDSGNVSVLLGNGDATFRQGSVLTTADSDALFVATGDFNNDGKLDLAVAVNNSVNSTGPVSIFLGNGDGTFQSALNFGSDIAPQWLALADFNHDGNLDVVAVSGVSLWVLLGNGDGTLQSAVQYRSGWIPWQVVVGDFNEDGNVDVAVANLLDNDIAIFMGNGDGTFQTPIDVETIQSPGALAVADLNRDGHADLVVGMVNEFVQHGQVKIFFGNGNGTFWNAPTRRGA
jgi:FG-GAP-like repeat